jgi:hypothetical protein
MPAGAAEHGIHGVGMPEYFSWVLLTYIKTIDTLTISLMETQ